MTSHKLPSPANAIPLGEWHARIALDVHGKAYARYTAPDGTIHDRLPRAARNAAKPEQVEQLRMRLGDIAAAQKEARWRLEQTYRNGRTWSFDEWKERYGLHPLMRSVAERLIWEFSEPGRPAFLALGSLPELTRIDGSKAKCSEKTTRVRLWHPADTDPVIAHQWRILLLNAEIRQPLWQAWRPVFTLTSPERETATYSNRFAGILLDQPAFVRVLRNRGWVLKSRMQGDEGPSTRAKPARLHLPGFGLTAEFWGRGQGQVANTHRYGAPNFEHFGTSQLRFYNSDSDSMKGAQPVPLARVSTRAFCEALFDIELVTGLSAVGFDTAWTDPGSQAVPVLTNRATNEIATNRGLFRTPPGELGEMRAEILQWLVPRLAIGDRLSLDGHILKIRGNWNDYEVHTGNAAVRIVGENRHLCIVPRGNSGMASGVALPFAGDETLAIILSKAHLLADETMVNDRDILDQLR